MYQTYFSVGKDTPHGTSTWSTTCNANAIKCIVNACIFTEMHSVCIDASAYIKNSVQIRNNKTVCSLIGLIYNHCWRMKKWPKMHAKCMHFSMHMSIYIVNAPYGHFLCCPYQIKMVFWVTFTSLTLYLHQKVFQCMLKLCWMLVFYA